MKQLRTALIGYGYWGPNIARNIHASPKFDLVAICEMNPVKLQRAKRFFGEAVRYFESDEAVLLDPSIDCIAIATHTSQNFRIAMAALSAGKHLFVEKPMTSTAEESELVAALAASRGLVVHTDHLLVYHPVIRRIRRMIDEGELGELLYYDSSRMNLGPIRADVSAMWDLAVHDLAVIDHLCDGQEPEYVDAVGLTKYGNKESLTYLTLKYGTFVAHLRSSWISPLKERKIIIAGTKKMVVFDDMQISEKLSIYDRGFDIDYNRNSATYGSYEVKARTGDLLVPYMPEEDSLRNSLEHFAECVATGVPSLSGALQASRVLRILERADRRLHPEE